MTPEEFREEYRKEWGWLWGNSYNAPCDKTVDWILDKINMGQTTTTWERIREQHAKLCELSRYDARLVVCASSGMMMVLGATIGNSATWLINYTDEDDFLKRLTAMVDERRPVTKEEAAEAWAGLDCGDLDRDKNRQTVDRYFKQKAGGDA